MATLLKSANFGGKNGTHFKLHLYYDYSQSVNNNQTTITYTLYMQSYDGYSGYGSTATGYINGASVGTFSSIGANATITIGTKTVTVNHNADGTFPSTSYSAKIDTPWTLGDAEVSGDLTGLPTIPRKSNATLSSSTFNIGSSITLTTNRASSSFTHKVVLAFGSYSKTYNNVGASQVINTNEFKDNLYAQIPNAKTGVGTITTTTFNGGTNLGSTSVNFTANAVESDCRPTVSGYTYTVDSTTSTLANTTTFIANVTTSTVSITGTANKSSTLKKSILCYVSNGTIINIITGDINAGSGTFNLTLQPNQVRSDIWVGLQDSRGYITYAGTFPATWRPYVSLTADQSAQIARTNQTEAKVKITQFKGNYWNDSFRSGNANTLTITWKYKESTASTWSTSYTIPAASITIANGTYTISNYTLTDGSSQELFNYQKAYNIQFSVTDKVGTKTSSYTITAGQPNFAIFPNHVLFNKNYTSKLQSDVAFLWKNYPVDDISDWNNLYDQKGKYMGSGKSNAPTGRTTSNWWFIDQHIHNGSYKKQIGYAFSDTNNSIRIRGKNGNTWGEWYAIKPDTTMQVNPEITTSGGIWTRVCRLIFAGHVQGEFAQVRIFIGKGNNGAIDQNCYIDLTMQQGWTGSLSGRPGCNARLHSLRTTANLTNTKIKVLANATDDYYVWVYSSVAYNRANFYANTSELCDVIPAYYNTSTEPTGTECNMDFSFDGMTYGSINNGADHYIKYDNGFMECFGKFSGTYNVSNAFGNGFYANTSSHSFAQTFTWAPVLNVSIYASSGLYTFSINENTTTSFKGFIWTCRSTNNQELAIYYHATGYWK